MAEQDLNKVTVRNKMLPQLSKMATAGPSKMSRTPNTKAKFVTSTMNKKKVSIPYKTKRPETEEILAVADLSGICFIQSSPAPPPKRKVLFDDKRAAEALKIKGEKLLR